jgi:class 3 adenylate cyclase
VRDVRSEPRARRHAGQVGGRWRDDLGARTGRRGRAHRGCDWFGSAVNVAARLARQAQPNEALVSATTRAGAGARLAATLDGRRDVPLRGVPGTVAAWRLA